jgi:predicted permease
VRALLFTALARVRGLLRPDAADRDFEAELGEHLRMAEDAKVRRGMSREAARREARLELGGLTQLMESGRDARGLPWLSGVWLDLKLAVRLLAKHPGLTLVSTVALSIGIAIVAGFHAGTNFFVNPSLPVPDEDEVVAIWNYDVAAADRGSQTVGDMLALRAELRSVDDVGAFARYQRVVAVADGSTRLIRTAQISPSLFRAVQVPPHLGRALVEADERPNGPNVALIGFDLWQTGFGGDPGVLGRTIRLGGVEHTVVGVMPQGFAFPQVEQLWTPLQPASASLRPGEGPEVEFVVGRLASGATIEGAEVELRVVGERLEADYPRMHARLRLRISTYARSFFQANEPELPVLITAARVSIGIILLVVAVNVGTLVYARNASRIGEVVVRSALGASRRRIVLQMFAEALVLGSLAAAIALGVMIWPITTLGNLIDDQSRQGGGVPYWFDVGIGPDTILLIAGLVVGSAVLTGILPALKLTSRRMGQGLARMQDQSAGLRFGRTATAVVVVQVALSVALLTVAGAQLWTLAKSWVEMEGGDIASDEYLVADLRWDLTPAGESGVDLQSDDVRRRGRTWRALGQRLSQEPAVRDVTFSSGGAARPFALDGVSTANRETMPWSYLSSIEPNFFETFGRPILSGRAFGPADPGGPGARVAIVNEEFLRRTRSPGRAVGGQLRQVDPLTGRPVGDPLEIVGVVGDFLGLDITHQGPGWRAYPTVYVPLGDTAGAVRVTIHVAGEPSALVGLLRGVAAEIDPTLVVHQPGTRAEREEAGLVFVRLYGYAVGFVMFAVLLLSTAGTYSMMSFTVSQRTREIGIRTALGARPRQVVTDVFSRAIRQLGLGTLLGLGIGALASNVFAASSAFAQGPTLPLGIAVLLLALGLVACGRPVRRALRIQPTQALRDAT